MFAGLSDHAKAVLQAIFVVMLWATSWVLIKFGLGSIPALTFAGLRYMMALVVLGLVTVRGPRLDVMRGLSINTWLRLGLLGLLLYTMAQGAQFMALSLLPAITTNLILSFITAVVALLGMVFLKEHPHPLQWVGIGLYLSGVIVYFAPVFSMEGTPIPLSGIIAALVCVFSNAFASILGRQVNRKGDLDPTTITLISMGIGAVLLLATGAITQGIPRIDARGWLIVAWLAVVNTAFAFTLWNHTLRTLSAMESSIINNLMMVFIPLLAWLFLDETVTTLEGIGMVLAGLGVLTVQLRRNPRIAAQPAARVEPVPEEIG